MTREEAASVGFYPVTMQDSEGEYTLYKPFPAFPAKPLAPLLDVPSGSTEAKGLRAFSVVRKRFEQEATSEGATEGDLLAVLLSLWLCTPSKHRQTALDHWENLKSQGKRGVHTSRAQTQEDKSAHDN